MKHHKNKILLITFWFFGYTIINAQNLNLRIVGLNESETTTIDSLSYKSSFSNYKALDEEVIKIQKRLQNQGYIECKILETKKINDSVFESMFSLKQKFHTIYIYHNKKLITEDLIGTISTNYNNNFFTIPITKIESSLELINSELAKKGLPFSKVKLKNIEKRDQTNLQADLLIDNDSERNIDNIIVKGYEQFPKSFLKHFLKVKSSQLFNLNDIRKKTEQLNNLSFASQSKSPEVLFTKDSTTLYLYLEKSKSNSFDGFLGFGTNETSNKLQFDGYLNLRLINNLNYGEQFKLIYKSDENEQKTFDANLTLPYLFNSPVGTELALNIFKKDSTFTTVIQNANIFYQINSKHTLFSGIKAIQSNDLLNENALVDIQDYNSIFYKTQYVFKKNNFNDFLFPINFHINISVGFGNRNSGNIREQQQEINAISSKIFNLDKKNSLFIKGTFNSLLSDSYFTNELYRFGGINSIRGFEENSILANYYGLINLEYRYRLNSVFYIHSITDASYFENKLTSSKEKLFGFGFGFGIFTKAGLLKLNYANGKSESQKFKLSNSKIHISLNAFF